MCCGSMAGVLQKIGSNDARSVPHCCARIIACRQHAKRMNIKRLAYVCLEEFHGAFYTQTASSGRQENGFAGTEHETCAISLSDNASSAESDEDDEGVKRGVVEVDGLVEVVN